MKCGRDADEAAEWRQRYPDAITTVGLHRPYGWNRVTLDGTVPEDESAELIDASYDDVVSRLPRSKRP